MNIYLKPSVSVTLTGDVTLDLILASISLFMEEDILDADVEFILAYNVRFFLSLIGLMIFLHLCSCTQIFQVEKLIYTQGRCQEILALLLL